MAKWRRLCFDIETMPVGFDDYEPEAEIVAMCWKWIGEQKPPVYWLLRPELADDVLEMFVEEYNAADLVVGQYIRKFDLPTINGALMVRSLPQLAPKLTSDTKSDWGKKRGHSASLESHLVYYQEWERMVKIRGKMYKAHLGKAHWRLIYTALCSLRSNGWAKSQLDLLRARCQGDVLATIKVYREMVKLGHLGSPKVWRP